jgi:hypothetical protein
MGDVWVWKKFSLFSLFWKNRFQSYFQNLIEMKNVFLQYYES